MSIRWNSAKSRSRGRTTTPMSRSGHLGWSEQCGGLPGFISLGCLIPPWPKEPSESHPGASLFFVGAERERWEGSCGQKETDRCIFVCMDIQVCSDGEHSKPGADLPTPVLNALAPLWMAEQEPPHPDPMTMLHTSRAEFYFSGSGTSSTRALKPPMIFSRLTSIC